VAAEVRGGTGLRHAATDVLDTHQLTGQVVRHPLLFDRLAQTPIDHPDEAVVAQSLATALQLGGSTAGVVQAGANLLRERAAVRAEARAHSAQARLSARVLTLVPVGFAAWSGVASTTFRRALLTPAGLTSATLGIVTNSIGWWWMRHIVHRATV
jgi:Flp pilus assembly protein TadB